MNQEIIEAVLGQFQHAYDDLVLGKPQGLLLAQLSISRLRDYSHENGQVQHYLRIVEEDYKYAKAAFALAK